MEWTDTALVLHVGRFREADLWVRLLAPGQGLVTAFAFGGSKSRRRFTGCLDVFNLIRTGRPSRATACSSTCRRPPCWKGRSVCAQIGGGRA